jgi:hypothetical protein
MIRTVVACPREVESKINVPRLRVNAKADRTRGRPTIPKRASLCPTAGSSKSEGHWPLANITYTPRLSSLDTAVDLDRKDVEGGTRKFPVGIAHGIIGGYCMFPA